MNRSELVRAVAERAGSGEADARRHVDAVFETVMEQVSAGERVTVTGFGTFDSFSRPARTARNPRTGAPIEVAAAEVPRFRSGQTFRTRVAQAAPPEAGERAAESARPDVPPAVADDEAKPKKPKAAKAAKAAKNGKKAKNAKSDKSEKSGKGGKKLKKRAPTRKAPKRDALVKFDAASPAKNAKHDKDGKKSTKKGQTKQKLRVQAGT